MNGGMILIVTIFVVILAQNIFVTRRVYKSDYYEPHQKHLQYALIWLLPVLGATLCYLFVRDMSGIYSGKYAEENSLYGDGDVGTGSADIDFFEGGHHGD